MGRTLQAPQGPQSHVFTQSCKSAPRSPPPVRLTILGNDPLLPLHPTAALRRTRALGGTQARTIAWGMG